MFSLTSSLKYYLHIGATDMRKSFDILCGLVHGHMGRSPIGGEVYIFINRERNRIKLLHWEFGGFVLYYRQELEKLKRMIFGSKSERYIPANDGQLRLGLDIEPIEKKVSETPIAVLTKDKPGSTHKGYYWVYYSPLDRLVCFDYQKGRGRDGPDAFLKGYYGTIQTDGYSVYDAFEKPGKIVLLSCMAHARRKFDEALNNDPQGAEYVLNQMQRLYKVERQAREGNFSFEQRKELREKESIPVLNELEKWMKDKVTEVLPKSAMGMALTYTLGLWNRLIRYTDDGRYEIDNNLVENSIRPVALGRKNYMFAGSHEAAARAAMIYSFLGTCKKNNVNYYDWLKDILERIPDHKANRLMELLPGEWIGQSSTIKI